jgi:uncharacterized damage-inducible protein DinB
MLSQSGAWEEKMKRMIWIAVLCLLAPVAARSQGSTSNPASTAVRRTLGSYSKNLVAAAQEMPAEKYSYHPTPENMTFGKSIAHIAEVNNFACSKVSDMPAPQTPKLNETDKDKLVEALQASVDFCAQAFAKLTDATLGDQVPWFGGRQIPRISAALEVTNDLVDHYAALAVYMRLNGLLPPTAQPKK